MIKHTQTIRWQQQQLTNCLSVFDHSVGLALKGIKPASCIRKVEHYLEVFFLFQFSQAFLRYALCHNIVVYRPLMLTMKTFYTNFYYTAELFHKTQHKIVLRNIEAHHDNGTNKPPLNYILIDV